MKLLSAIILIFSISLIQCKGKDADSILGTNLDSEEMGQQVGDSMASIDEAGGSTGALSLLEQESKVFARWIPSENPKNLFMTVAVPTAQAAACSTVNFGSCTNNVITRTYGGCSIGSATFSGNVTLTYDDAAVDNTCNLAANNYSVTRVPAYTVTGLRSATLTVSKAGSVGQKITRTGVGQFKMENDGIRRKFDYNGNTLFDYTTTIPSSDPLIISGTNRSGRTLNSGKIIVTNNSNSSNCTLTPSAVTWNGTCNCAVSGSWSGTCGDSTTTVAITGCGSATVTMGTTSRSVTFDRCY